MSVPVIVPHLLKTSLEILVIFVSKQVMLRVLKCINGNIGHSQKLSLKDSGIMCAKSLSREIGQP